jgi:hypothetical protein
VGKQVEEVRVYGELESFGDTEEVRRLRDLLRRVLGIARPIAAVKARDGATVGREWIAVKVLRLEGSRPMLRSISALSEPTGVATNLTTP